MNDMHAKVQDTEVEAKIFTVLCTSQMCTWRYSTVYVHARETEVSSLHLDLLPPLRLLRNWLCNSIREPTVSPQFALWILKPEGKEKMTWDRISPSSIQRTHSASPRSSRRLISPKGPRIFGKPVFWGFFILYVSTVTQKNGTKPHLPLTQNSKIWTTRSLWEWTS